VPFYEYQCKACGHIFEREHAIGEKKSYKCPECSSGRTQRLISQVGVIFKGSGFYKTDNRNNNGRDSGKSCSSDKSSQCQSCPLSEN
jgi:putative FmdB family regulatory protein